MRWCENKHAANTFKYQIVLIGVQAIMKEVKLDRKSRYTRLVLQESLIGIIKEKPIHKITIKELCERADINRTTFYAHYIDQYDLLHQIEEATLSWARDVITNVTGQTGKPELLTVLEEICQHIMENSRHLQVLMSEQGNIHFQKQLFTLIYQQCGAGFADAPSGDEGSLAFSLSFVANGSAGIIQHWINTGMRRSAKEIAEIIYKIAITGKL